MKRKIPIFQECLPKGSPSQPVFCITLADKKRGCSLPEVSVFMFFFGLGLRES
jgi:hypothetical protein